MPVEIQCIPKYNALMQDFRLFRNTMPRGQGNAECRVHTLKGVCTVHSNIALAFALKAWCSFK